MLKIYSGALRSRGATAERSMYELSSASVRLPAVARRVLRHNLDLHNLSKLDRRGDAGVLRERPIAGRHHSRPEPSAAGPRGALPKPDLRRWATRRPRAKSPPKPPLRQREKKPCRLLSCYRPRPLIPARFRLRGHRLMRKRGNSVKAVFGGSGTHGESRPPAVANTVANQLPPVAPHASAANGQ